MSAFGPKQTSLVAPRMSAFGGKADMPFCAPNVCFCEMRPCDNQVSDGLLEAHTSRGVHRDVACVDERARHLILDPLNCASADTDQSRGLQDARALA